MCWSDVLWRCALLVFVVSAFDVGHVVGFPDGPEDARLREAAGTARGAAITAGMSEEEARREMADGTGRSKLGRLWSAARIAGSMRRLRIRCASAGLLAIGILLPALASAAVDIRVDEGERITPIDPRLVPIV